MCTDVYLRRRGEGMVVVMVVGGEGDGSRKRDQLVFPFFL